MDSLPIEVLLEIFKFLPWTDLVSMTLVSRKMYLWANAPRLWTNYLFKFFCHTNIEVLNSSRFSCLKTLALIGEFGSDIDYVYNVVSRQTIKSVILADFSAEGCNIYPPFFLVLLQKENLTIRGGFRRGEFSPLQNDVFCDNLAYSNLVSLCMSDMLVPCNDRNNYYVDIKELTFIKTTFTAGFEASFFPALINKNGMKTTKLTFVSIGNECIFRDFAQGITVLESLSITNWNPRGMYLLFSELTFTSPLKSLCLHRVDLDPVGGRMCLELFANVLRVDISNCFVTSERDELRTLFRKIFLLDNPTITSISCENVRLSGIGPMFLSYSLHKLQHVNLSGTSLTADQCTYLFEYQLIPPSSISFLDISNNCMSNLDFDCVVKGISSIREVVLCNVLLPNTYFVFLLSLCSMIYNEQIPTKLVKLRVGDGVCYSFIPKSFPYVNYKLEDGIFALSFS